MTLEDYKESLQELYDTAYTRGYRDAIKEVKEVTDNLYSSFEDKVNDIVNIVKRSETL